jgi:cell division protein FtsQ
MDGRGRLLRSLEQDDFSSNGHPALNLCFVACPDAKPVSTFAGHALKVAKVANFGFAPAAPSSAGAVVPAAFSLPAETRPPVRRPRRGLTQKILNNLAKPGTAAFFALALFTVVGVYGAIMGGHYAAFVSEEGEPADIIAKGLGFSIKAVTISGAHELKEQDILATAGVGPRNSLLFLDAAKIREKLKLLPIVKEAAITKLYPDRLLIEVEERQPFALWQNDGETRIVAEDGVVLGLIQDRRFIHLPFVAGAGANDKIGEYLALLESAANLRERIMAGVRVARRRWTLKLTNGLEILLPERAPTAAMARLIELQRVYHILDKDVLLLDLRQPDRLIARLSAEAAAARESASAPPRTAKAKGGRT